jgi:transposase
MLWERGRAYSQDLRERVFAAWEAGLRVGEIAEQLLVSIAYVSKALGRERRTGERTVRPQRCHITPRLAAYHDAIGEHVLANPDVTLAELQAWLRDAHDVSASIGLICMTLKKLGLTTKKKSLQAAEQDRPDVAAARTEWRQQQPNLDPDKLIFIDETSTKTNMTRLHGRAPRGKRLVGAVPFGHWKTSTLIAGLRHDGMGAWRVR